jgi:hypothetical protein
MKRCLFFIGLGVLLVSCVGLPAPKSPGNSLVIGNFIMDFPDGFFNVPKRTFDFDVQLNFMNLTQGTGFTISTSREGYFFFLANGSDKYLFKSFELQQIREGNNIYTWGKTPMNLEISATPDKVIYLGHILVTYTKPKFAKRTGVGADTELWNFESSFSTNWDKDAVIRYIKATQRDSPWLNYEVLEYEMKE